MLLYNEKFPEKVEGLKEKTRLEELVLEIRGNSRRKNKPLSLKDELRVKVLNRKIEKLKIDIEKDSNEKYLSEIVISENTIFSSNSLIISPVGSGKTTLIDEVLLKGETNKTLILVSTKFLKESTLFAQSLKKNNVKLKVMTYHEFGLRISNNNHFAEKFSQIFCDEIHSLPEYRNYTTSGNRLNYALEHAVKYLFNKQEGKNIYYFTATDSSLKELMSKRKDLMKDVSVYDFRNHPNIKKYIEISKIYVNHIEQIEYFLTSNFERLNYFKYKGIGFDRTIRGLKKLEELLIKVGFNPLVLWSTSNNDYQLDEKQLKARAELIKTGIIPEGYDFLLINSSMREGWNLKDKDVKFAIMNTTNETDIIQSRGRVRQDLDLIIFKDSEDKSSIKNEYVLMKYLNRDLTATDKEKLCLELDIRNRNNHIFKWNKIKELLINEGYSIKETKKRINGKQIRFSVISSKGGKEKNDSSK